MHGEVVISSFINTDIHKKSQWINMRVVLRCVVVVVGGGGGGGRVWCVGGVGVGGGGGGGVGVGVGGGWGGGWGGYVCVSQNVVESW